MVRANMPNSFLKSARYGLHRCRLVLFLVLVAGIRTVSAQNFTQLLYRAVNNTYSDSNPTTSNAVDSLLSMLPVLSFNENQWTIQSNLYIQPLAFLNAGKINSLENEISSYWSRLDNRRKALALITVLQEHALLLDKEIYWLAAREFVPETIIDEWFLNAEKLYLQDLIFARSIMEKQISEFFLVDIAQLTSLNTLMGELGSPNSAFTKETEDIIDQLVFLTNTSDLIDKINDKNTDLHRLRSNHNVLSNLLRVGLDIPINGSYDFTSVQYSIKPYVSAELLGINGRATWTLSPTLDPDLDWSLSIKFGSFFNKVRSEPPQSSSHDSSVINFLYRTSTLVQRYMLYAAKLAQEKADRSNYQSFKKLSDLVDQALEVRRLEYQIHCTPTEAMIYRDSLELLP